MIVEFFLGRFLQDRKNIIQLLSSAVKMHPYHLLYQHGIPPDRNGVLVRRGFRNQQTGLLDHRANGEIGVALSNPRRKFGGYPSRYGVVLGNR